MNSNQNVFTVRLYCQNLKKHCFVKTSWHDKNFDSIIIYDKNAYESNVSQDTIEELAEKYKIEFGKYFEDIKCSLTEKESNLYSYSIRNDTFFISRKKGKITAQIADFNLHSKNFNDVALSVISEMTQLNESYLNQVLEYETRLKKANEETQQYRNELENFVTKKQQMENELYSKFITVLNEKKIRIDHLQNMLKNFETKSSNNEWSNRENKLKREILSSSDSDNSLDASPNKITHQVQIERANLSPKQDFDFLDDKTEEVIAFDNIAKRVRVSKNKTDFDKTGKHANMEDIDTIALVPNDVDNSATNAKNETVSEKVNDVDKVEQTEDSLNFDTQDLFDRF